MTGGILDYLENGWQSILGMPGSSGQSPGVPPQIFGAPPSNSFSPSGLMDGGTMLAPGNPTGAPPTQPPNPQQNYNLAQGGFPTNTQGADPNAPFPNGATALPGGPSPNVPLPTPQPASAPIPGYPPDVSKPPLDIRPDPNQFLPPNSGVATTLPPQVPPQNFNGAPPTSTGSLEGALGISPTTIKTALAGLGQGLSAVGKMRPGTPGGQAFAAGAGGALEGVDKADNQLFNQSSVAFRNMLAAQSQNDTEAYRRAQGDYLMSRANAIKLGGTSSSAWQNTPYGRMIQVENEAQKYEKGQQILLQKRWQMNGSTPEQQQKDIDDLQKRTDAYRTKLYQSAGVDPKQGGAMKNWGTAPETPFETKGMTLDQFNSQVPMGAWFKDQNGAVRQRTVPPGGFGAPQSNNGTTAQNGMDNYTADQLAMQPTSDAAIQ